MRIDGQGWVVGFCHGISSRSEGNDSRVGNSLRDPVNKVAESASPYASSPRVPLSLRQFRGGTQTARTRHRILHSDPDAVDAGRARFQRRCLLPTLKCRCSDGALSLILGCSPERWRNTACLPTPNADLMRAFPWIFILQIRQCESSIMALVCAVGAGYGLWQRP